MCVCATGNLSLAPRRGSRRRRRLYRSHLCKSLLRMRSHVAMMLQAGGKAPHQKPTVGNSVGGCARLIVSFGCIRLLSVQLLLLILLVCKRVFNCSNVVQ